MRVLAEMGLRDVPLDISSDEKYVHSHVRIWESNTERVPSGAHEEITSDSLKRKLKNYNGSTEYGAAPFSVKWDIVPRL